MATATDPRRELRAVVVKLDGVLLRTREIVARIYREAFHKQHIHVEDDDLLIGLNPWHAVAHFAKRSRYTFEQHEVDAITDAFRSLYYDAVFGKTELLHPHAVDFLQSAHRNSLKVALVHACDRAHDIAASLGLAEHCDAIVDISTQVRGKSTPNLTQQAFAQLQISPQAGCGIATSPTGIRAVAQAGACPVGIVDGVDVGLLFDEGAFVSYSDLGYLSFGNLRDAHSRWRTTMHNRARGEKQSKKNGAKLCGPQQQHDDHAENDE